MAWVLVALAAVWAIRGAGRKDARHAAKIDALQRDNKTAQRIDNADLGLGATDLDRIKRLREFAGKP